MNLEVEANVGLGLLNQQSSRIVTKDHASASPYAHLVVSREGFWDSSGRALGANLRHFRSSGVLVGRQPLWLETVL